MNACKKDCNHCTIISKNIFNIKNSYTSTHSKTLFGMGISEALNIVEDEPGKGDDHEDDEGDGDKENGGFADTTVRRDIGGLLLARCNGHHNTHALVS